MCQTIMTVTGEIKSQDLGITLTHEHLMVDVRNWLLAPPENDEFLKTLSKEKVNIDNRGDLIYYCCYSEDNMHQTDPNVSINEAIKFKEAGGSSIIDLTLDSIGRNPEALLSISLATGLNVVMGCGYYVESSWTKEEKRLPAVVLAKRIMDEFSDGVKDSNIRPGIIGEIGLSNIDNPIELKGLDAAAIASAKTGASINVHMPIWDKEGHKILDFLQERKINPERVILSHCDPTFYDPSYHDSLAKRGAYISFDEFGMELMTPELRFLPSDGERINAIAMQIKKGNLERILISQDIDTKICLSGWGGFGLGHILKHIKPRMINSGIKEDDINTIMVDNPARILSFA